MSDNRGSFSGRIGFILAAAGSAIGLGNIWRFPYLAGQNGGAMFLILYLVFVFGLCFPVMVGEIAIGRKAKSDAFGSYAKLGNRKWGLLGLFGILVGVLILSFYNVVSGWALAYFVNISFGDLLSTSDFGSYFGDFVNNINLNILFSLCFMVMTAVIVSGGVQKGIEAANKIMMPGLFLILIGLTIYGLTLPNAWEGVKYYLVPDVSEIKAQTFFDGLRMAFFSLSLGMAAMVTYGSYLDKSQNIASAASVISISGSAVGFLAGLMVFPLVFSLNMSPAQGPPLVFILLPQVFSEMGPVLGRVVGGSFFLLLCFAALTSTVSLLEVPVAYLVDQKKLPRKTMVWVMAAIIFVAGIPSMLSQGIVPSLNKLSFYQDRDFLTLIADFCDISLTIGGGLMCVFITYKWRIHNMNDELEFGNEGYKSSWLKRYVNFMIMYICPALLGIMSIGFIIDRFYGIDKILGN